MDNQKSTALVVIGWTLYVLFALLLVLFAAMEKGFIVMLVTGTTFIFGPKLWRHI